MYVRKTPINPGSKHTYMHIYIHTESSPVALTNLLNLIVFCWIKADSRPSKLFQLSCKMPTVAAAKKMTKFYCKSTVSVVSGGSTNLLSEGANFQDLAWGMGFGVRSSDELGFINATGMKLVCMYVCMLLKADNIHVCWPYEGWQHWQHTCMLTWF